MPWTQILKFFSNIIIGVITDALKTPAVETIVELEYGIIDDELFYWDQGEEYNHLRIPDSTNKETNTFD